MKSESDSGRMIFITGASRSGTTLLSFILRNNSKVFGLKELHYFGDLWNPRVPERVVPESQLVNTAAALFARQLHGVLATKAADSAARERATKLVATLTAEQRTMAAVFEAVISDLCREAGKTVPCEHTPRNIFYADALLDLYPQAHVIHVVRDPRAVMASQKRRWQRRKLAAEQSNFPLSQTLRVWVNYHPYTIAKLWRRAAQKALQLAHHDRFTVIQFENLVAEPKSTVGGLCERLGLQFESAMLDIGQVNSSHNSSVGGAKKGFNLQTVDAWRSHLTPTEVAVTEDLCGATMTQFGYEPARENAVGSSARLFCQLGYAMHLAGVLAINPRRAWIQTRALLGSSPR
jgi:hypothetical protein